MKIHHCFSIIFLSVYPVSGFQSGFRTQPSVLNSSKISNSLPKSVFEVVNGRNIPTRRISPLYGRTQDGENNILDRFLEPKIDDAGLPLADALIAQIVAPTLEIFWLSSQHAPSKYKRYFINHKKRFISETHSATFSSKLAHSDFSIKSICSF